MKRISLPTIAFFVTPHGFGHASRTCAVMAALRERNSTLGFEIYTTVPEWFFKASIQTEPVCEYRQNHLLAAPAGRKFRTDREITRKKLGIPENAHVVMLTFGGVPDRNDVASRLHRQKDVFFIVPGAFQSIRKTANTVMLPHHSEFFHPDLILASDTVVGKAGYSTIAMLAAYSP